MKTAVTELFGIPYPILNAGMGRVALPNLAAAVSNAGGLGVIGAGSSPPDLTREYIRTVRSLTDKPFGINCPLALPNAMDNARVALEEKVPVINYSMGKGDWIVKAAHAYGGKVIASVTDTHFAQRAQAHGADAVIAAGHEAAGHAGSVTVFVLAQRLAELIKVPIITAGGVANGSGLVAALALGASGVSMGTRFLLTKESPMHQNFKNKALELDVQDTIYSDKFDGIPCRQMRTEATDRVLAERLNIWTVFRNSFSIARELKRPYFSLLREVLTAGPKHTIALMRMARTLNLHTITLTTGDLKTGMTASGMSVGLVHDIPTVAEVIERIMAEAYACQRSLEGMFAAEGNETASSAATPSSLRA